MEQFKRLIDGDNFHRILEKDKITLNERFKLDSFTPYTLVDKIGNLKNEELNEVYHLEAKNLYRIINTAALLLGLFEESKMFLRNLMDTYEVRSILNEAEAEASNREEEKAMKFDVLANYVLSHCDMRNKLKPVFEGKVPKKAFSFRQDSADEWFSDYVRLTFYAASKILVKMDEENAFAYICSNVGWYLNKSQTFKYHEKSTDRDMNDTISRILKDFVISVGGNDLYVKNNPSAPLYKDL